MPRSESSSRSRSSPSRSRSRSRSPRRYRRRSHSRDRDDSRERRRRRSRSRSYERRGRGERSRKSRRSRDRSGERSRSRDRDRRRERYDDRGRDRYSDDRYYRRDTRRRSRSRDSDGLQVISIKRCSRSPPRDEGRRRFPGRGDRSSKVVSAGDQKSKAALSADKLRALMKAQLTNADRWGKDNEKGGAKDKNGSVVQVSGAKRWEREGVARGGDLAAEEADEDMFRPSAMAARARLVDAVDDERETIGQTGLGKHAKKKLRRDDEHWDAIFAPPAAPVEEEDAPQVTYIDSIEIDAPKRPQNIKNAQKTEKGKTESKNDDGDDLEDLLSPAALAGASVVG